MFEIAPRLGKPVLFEPPHTREEFKIPKKQDFPKFQTQDFSFSKIPDHDSALAKIPDHEFLTMPGEDFMLRLSPLSLTGPRGAPGPPPPPVRALQSASPKNLPTGAVRSPLVGLRRGSRY